MNYTHSSSHHIFVNKLPVEFRTHIVVNITLLLLYALCLILEDSVLVPTLRQAVC
jgi:hypothetical protein